MSALWHIFPFGLKVTHSFVTTKLFQESLTLKAPSSALAHFLGLRQLVGQDLAQMSRSLDVFLYVWSQTFQPQLYATQTIANTNPRLKAQPVPWISQEHFLGLLQLVCKDLAQVSAAPGVYLYVLRLTLRQSLTLTLSNPHPRPNRP